MPQLFLLRHLFSLLHASQAVPLQGWMLYGCRAMPCKDIGCVATDFCICIQHPGFCTLQPLIGCIHGHNGRAGTGFRGSTDAQALCVTVHVPLMTAVLYYQNPQGTRCRGGNAAAATHNSRWPLMQLHGDRGQCCLGCRRKATRHYYLPYKSSSSILNLPVSRAAALMPLWPRPITLIASASGCAGPKCL